MKPTCLWCKKLHNRDRKATRAHYPFPNSRPHAIRYYCGHCFNHLLSIMWIDDDEELIWRLV
jgi:hypothetical protein